MHAMKLIRRFRAWLGMKLLLGLAQHESGTTIFTSLAPDTRVEPQAENVQFTGTLTIQTPTTHACDCGCLPCCAVRARQREAFLFASIDEWNRAVAQIPTERWHPITYPETRQ
jgi:hypothetical protein